MAPTDTIEHGTYGGYQAHRKAGERGDQICAPCRVANNAYQAHPDEFRKLYDAELTR